MKYSPSKGVRRAFTLVEIMIVVAIIGMLTAIAIPGFINARKNARRKRIQADLRTIDSATRQYVLEYKVGTDAGMPVMLDLVSLRYLNKEPEPPVPGIYTVSATLEGFPQIVPDSGVRDPEWYLPEDPDRPN